MANLGGFHALGHFLAGGNAPQAALMEAQGESLGANTENAIAQAQERLAKNKALADPALAGKLAGLAGSNPQLGDALHGLVQAGIINPDNFIKAIGENQKNAGTAVVADPNSTDEQVARANLAREPNTPGLIRPTAQGEASTNVLHPDKGLTMSPLGTALLPAKVEGLKAKAALDRDMVANTEHYHHTPMGGGPVSPEDQATLTRLINAGVIDPAHITRYNASPIAVRSAGAALDSGNYNPGLHASTTLQAQEKGFTSNTPSSAGGRLRAGNAVSSHLKMLQALADAQDANDLPAVQKLYTAITGQTGSDVPTMNRLASDFVGRELDGFLSAGNPTLQGHTEAAGHFNQNEIGSQQLRSNVGFGKKLMGGQYGALKQEYASAPGRTPQDVKNFSNRFMGGNRDLLDDFEREHGEIVPGTPSSAAAAPSAPLPGVAPSAAPAGNDPLGLFSGK